MTGMNTRTKPDDHILVGMPLYPSGQGQDAGGFRLISILVEHQDRYDRFAMITGADDQL